MDVSAEQPVQEVPRRRVVWLELAALLLVLYVPALASEFLPRTYYYVPTLMSVVYRMTYMIGRIALISFVVWTGDGSLRALGIAKPRNVKLDVVLVACAIAATLLLEFVPRMMLSRAVTNAGRIGLSPSDNFLFYGIPLSLTLIALVFTVIYEEVFFRGYLISRLREQLGNYWAPILLSSILFASFHFYQGYYGMTIIAIHGALLGLVFALSGRIWPAIIVHYLLDAYFISYYAYYLAHQPY